MWVWVQNFHEEPNPKIHESGQVKPMDSSKLPSLPRYNRLAKLGIELVEF